MEENKKHYCHNLLLSLIKTKPIRILMKNGIKTRSRQGRKERARSLLAMLSPKCETPSDGTNTIRVPLILPPCTKRTIRIGKQ